MRGSLLPSLRPLRLLCLLCLLCGDALAARIDGQVIHPTKPEAAAGLSVHLLGVTRDGETLLFECGEGTQRQMMRYGVGFTLSEIFITHYHADHFLGIIRFAVYKLERALQKPVPGIRDEPLESDPRVREALRS